MSEVLVSTKGSAFSWTVPCLRLLLTCHVRGLSLVADQCRICDRVALE